MMTRQEIIDELKSIFNYMNDKDVFYGLGPLENLIKCIENNNNKRSILDSKIEDFLECDDDTGRAHYLHSPFCEGACDYDCMGKIGFRIAEQIEHDTTN